MEEKKVNVRYVGTGAKVNLTDGRTLKLKDGMTISISERDFNSLSFASTGSYELVIDTPKKEESKPDKPPVKADKPGKDKGGK